jgi:hypothetical protein
LSSLAVEVLYAPRHEEFGHSGEIYVCGGAAALVLANAAILVSEI